MSGCPSRFPRPRLARPAAPTRSSGGGSSHALLAFLLAAAAPAAARASGEEADASLQEVAPAVREALERTDGPAAAVQGRTNEEEGEAAERPAETPDIATSPDEQTGYYYAFAFAATVGELFGGCLLGLGIASLVDGYDRDDLAALAAAPEDADALASDADDLKTLGWVTLGVGSLGLGLGLALDVVLGREFGDEDWWLRVGVTTPLATAGMALLAGGLGQLDRAAALRDASPRLATLAARDRVRGDAADAETDGWILIGVGAAAILGAAAVWIKDAFDADDSDEPTDETEAGDPTAALLPLTFPGGGGLGLSLFL